MDTDDDSEREEERCPVCGGPITLVSILGPGTAIVSPCGHEVDPAVLDCE